MKDNNKSNYRFFCHFESQDLNKRNYYYYLFDTYNGRFCIYYKNSSKIYYSYYTLRMINSFVKRKLWIEIPAAEAVLMV